MQTLNVTLRDQSPIVKEAAIKLLRECRKRGMKRYQARDKVQDAVESGRFYALSQTK